MTHLTKNEFCAAVLIILHDAIFTFPFQRTLACRSLRETFHRANTWHEARGKRFYENFKWKWANDNVAEQATSLVGRLEQLIQTRSWTSKIECKIIWSFEICEEMR